jgi:hypothetical protein
MGGDVYIRYRKQRLFPATAVNCSVHGIFLRTESLTMLSGALVEIELFRNSRQWSIMGVVTHILPEGIGVMFWKPQPELYDWVVSQSKILQQSQLDALQPPVSLDPALVCIAQQKEPYQWKKS